jgi:ribokinase
MENKITVLGSVNYDSFIFVERPPEVGETITASGLKTACGGKGANQAVTIGKLGYPVDFVGQFGGDSVADTIKKEMIESNVNISRSSSVTQLPTGQAYIFSYPNKDNSIVVVGGANMDWSSNNLKSLQESIASCIYIVIYNLAKILLLQREIPESINIQASRIAKEHGVKIILDMGGADCPLSPELLGLVDIISPNKTELRRILNRSVEVTHNDEILEALKEMRSISNNKNLNLLLKLGSKGCLYIDNENNIFINEALKFDDMPIVDTTGAGNNGLI